MRLTRLALVALVASSFACAEGSGELTSELTQGSLRARTAVEKISSALVDPELASRALGEGVHQVELATRGLEAIEIDPRASESQRLWAVLYQARAWDDASRAIEQAPAASLDPAQTSLYRGLLAEKAFPAKVAAQSAYHRALRLACHLGPEGAGLVPEIVDGIGRFGGEVPAQACGSDQLEPR